MENLFMGIDDDHGYLRSFEAVGNAVFGGSYMAQMAAHPRHVKVAVSSAIIFLSVICQALGFPHAFEAGIPAVVLYLGVAVAYREYEFAITDARRKADRQSLLVSPSFRLLNRGEQLGLDAYVMAQPCYFSNDVSSCLLMLWALASSIPRLYISQHVGSQAIIGLLVAGTAWTVVMHWRATKRGHRNSLQLWDGIYEILSFLLESQHALGMILFGKSCCSALPPWMMQSGILWVVTASLTMHLLKTFMRFKFLAVGRGFLIWTELIKLVLQCALMPALASCIKLPVGSLAFVASVKLLLSVVVLSLRMRRESKLLVSYLTERASQQLKLSQELAFEFPSLYKPRPFAHLRAKIHGATPADLPFDLRQRILSRAQVCPCILHMTMVHIYV